MPGQSGSENRQRTIVRSTRWSEAEFAQLQDIAAASQCSEAEVLRRIVRRRHKNILISRDLVRAVNKVGVNINQIARQLNSNGPVTPADLRRVYADLVSLVRIAGS